MKRGDVVVAATGSGFGGKPRPALVVQADQFAAMSTLVLAPFTSELVGSHIRPRLEPTPSNGLRQRSDVMIDILVTARIEKLGAVIGSLSAEEMALVDRSLMIFLGLAGPPLDHRLFFAILPPADLAEEIGAARRSWARDGRSVALDRLHITIALFDDEARYPIDLADLAREAASSLSASSFRVVFDRVVGSPRSALLIPSEPLQGLKAFQHNLATSLTRAGLNPRQDWKFNPHMTLFYGDYRGLDLPVVPLSWNVDEFVLVHSLLRRGRHEIIERWQLPR